MYARLPAVAILVALGVILPRNAPADILWQWSFAGEKGTFITSGDLIAGLAPPATYTIFDFSVTQSSIPENLGSLSGGEYNANQPAQGFVWDGTQPTQFFRSSGTLTNGSNFFLGSTGRFYTFDPGESQFSDDDAEDPILIGDLKLFRIRDSIVLTYPGPLPCDATLQGCIDAAHPGDTVEIANDGPDFGLFLGVFNGPPGPSAPQDPE